MTSLREELFFDSGHGALARHVGEGALPAKLPIQRVVSIPLGQREQKRKPVIDIAFSLWYVPRRPGDAEFLGHLSPGGNRDDS
jgi:hypothetical protein